MSNITTINRPTERQTPIEIALQIDSEGMTMARALYFYLELNPSNYSKWARKNIVDNSFAIENVDYFSFVLQDERNPNPSTDYKLTADFAKKLCMVSKSPKGEEARDYFVQVEQNAKKFANNAPVHQDSLEVAAIMIDELRRQRDLAAQHETRINQIEQKVETVKEVLAPKKEKWREMIIKNIVSIAESAGVEYREIWTECYDELDRSGFDMKKRLRNSQSRMEKLGYSKTAVSRLKRIDVIERDPKAKEIFTNIVSRMVLKHVI